MRVLIYETSSRLNSHWINDHQPAGQESAGQEGRSPGRHMWLLSLWGTEIYAEWRLCQGEMEKQDWIFGDFILEALENQVEGLGNTKADPLIVLEQWRLRESWDLKKGDLVVI